METMMPTIENFYALLKENKRLQKKLFEDYLKLHAYENELGLCEIKEYKRFVSDTVFFEKRQLDLLKDGDKSRFMTEIFTRCSSSLVEPFAFMMTNKGSGNYRWKLDVIEEDVSNINPTMGKQVTLALICYIAKAWKPFVPTNEKGV